MLKCADGNEFVFSILSSTSIMFPVPHPFDLIPLLEPVPLVLPSRTHLPPPLPDCIRNAEIVEKPLIPVAPVVPKFLACTFTPNALATSACVPAAAFVDARLTELAHTHFSILAARLCARRAARCVGGRHGGGLAEGGFSEGRAGGPRSSGVSGYFVGVVICLLCLELCES